jgi:hypothetical protein
MNSMSATVITMSTAALVSEPNACRGVASVALIVEGTTVDAVDAGADGVTAAGGATGATATGAGVCAHARVADVGRGVPTGAARSV